MFSLTTKLSHHLENEKQQQQNLPQYTNHNKIMHLHWYSRCQGNILSTNLILLITLAIGLGGHSDEAMYKDK